MPLTIFVDQIDDLLAQIVALSQDIVNLLVSTISPGVAVGGMSLTLPLRSYGRARDLLSDLESLTHLLAVHGGGEPVAFRSEVLADGTILREETLRVPWGFKPLHPPLSLAGRLLRVFRRIVE
jgi:hypothetical protein